MSEDDVAKLMSVFDNQGKAENFEINSRNKTIRQIQFIIIEIIHD